jgi:tetratricopeptide (TPR) repeat protein
MTDLALHEPRAALATALRTLSGDLPVADRVAGLHAVARARIELGDSAAAGAALRTALRLATAAGLDLAELRLTMAWVHFDTGDLDACFGLLDLVAADPRALCLRGLACCAAGDYATAEPLLSTATGLLTDARWLANALCARGILRSYDAFRLPDADADFAAAQRLYASIGATERAASCLHNRGFVAFRSGDLPLALRLYDDAERAGMRSDQRGETLVDRAGALLAGGLVVEAAAVLERAARLLGDAGRGTTFAEATLSLARCALLSGSPDTAIRAATDAAAMFDRQGRQAWTAVARATQLRARFVAAPCGDLVPLARRVAAQCKQAGWRVEAAELLLAAADHARGPARTRLLTSVAAERSGPTAALRAVGWLARARLAADRRGVHAACRAGLRVVDEQIGLMGSLELQAGVAALGGALAGTGLRAALEAGQARQVLAWTDRYRSLTWRVAPVRPPADPDLVTDLARLRTVQDDLAATAGIEDGIRRRALAAPGAWSTAAATVDGLQDRLDSRALVSFVEQDAVLWASTMVGGTVRLQRIGPVDGVGAETERLRFATSVALRTGRGAEAATQSAELLDGFLFGPVRRVVGDRPLVIVPCGRLRKVPWAALPSCAGRPVSIVPSATAWLGASMAPAADGDPVWIAGPGLDHAEQEVRTLSGRFGGRALTGKAATVDETLAAVSGASVAHVAAHGTFRSDAPMFSNLMLADGPLYGYDLDRLDRSPRVLILSACDVGRSAGGLAGTPIGLASVVFRRGTAVLIASTMPVPDAQAADLMTTLHAGLHRGHSPAEALAAAQARHGHLGFTCVGAG